MLKKLILLHIVPILLALVALNFFVKGLSKQPTYTYSVANEIQKAKSVKHSYRFFPYDLTNQLALSLALKNKVPVLFGSSELTSNHLKGLAHNYFNQDSVKDKFLSVGHAGFQSLSILTVLAANRELIKDAKITIILSPGWFEKQYASGTSLNSFFEYCTPNYLYKIKQDSGIDNETKNHIKNYLYRNYDKISKPDATIRFLSKKDVTPFNESVNAPFRFFDDLEVNFQAKNDEYLISQCKIVDYLKGVNTAPYVFYNRKVNWDSLKTLANIEFAKISSNNDIAVENEYYENWVKKKGKKTLDVVDENNNQEFKDLLMLLRFLKINNCNAQFVIMPLNTLAHKNLDILQPTISLIKQELVKNNYKTLDMFSPNLQHYQRGVLEDIMHPYDLGWYQIDEFILNNQHD